MINKNDKKETVSYEELANRVGDMVRMNSIISDSDYYEYNECLNGEEYFKNEETGEYTEDLKECYQMFAINKSGADYLIYNTNELVYYNSKLDAYFWGITHWGTPWSGVYTEVRTF